MPNVIGDDLVTVPNDAGSGGVVALLTSMPTDVQTYLGVNTLKAFITVEGGKSRYRFDFDGSHAPTNARGHLVAAGDAIVLDSNLNKVKFKSNASETTDTTLTVTYTIEP